MYCITGIFLQEKIFKNHDLLYYTNIFLGKFSRKLIFKIWLFIVIHQVQSKRVIVYAGDARNGDLAVLWLWMHSLAEVRWLVRD